MLVVDDHNRVRAAVCNVLERAGIRVVAQAATARAALAAALRTPPALALIDVRLPDRSGVQVARDIRAANAQTRVLLLTAVDEDEALLATVFASADGYVAKEIGSCRLINAVRSVASGKPLLNARIAHAAVADLSRARTARSRLGDALSATDRRVVALVAAGKTDRQIATALRLPGAAIERYVKTVYEKLRAATWARRDAGASRH